ncbi:MAG: FAD-dependent oxidoreductase [Rhodospirillaceae bacterium]|nr:FAD-dependent oxidoreductase [Rhodospirillaceae bacterium]
MGLTLAIVGSGPSGFYTVESALEKWPDCTIDIIEKLPTPYGLIRYGVAPDHAKTKAVAKAYEKLALDPRVRFFGNVELGRDVSIEELRERYDAVVLATGCSTDKSLKLKGDDKKGVLGVASFVNWYNGLPAARTLDPPLNVENVVVIGVGNVAVDVARVLVKTPEEMAATDLMEHAAAAIHAAPIRDVYMVGRRGPLHAQFTNVELREMGHLKDAAPIVDPAQLPETIPDDAKAEFNERQLRLIQRNIDTLREFTKIDPGARRKRVHFVFFANPVEILGGERVSGVRFEKTRVEQGRAIGTGEFFEIPCGLVIPAIGYYSNPIPGVPFADGKTINEDGRIAPGLYAVGWIKRGPSGVIGTNKPDGDTAAAAIAADLGTGGGKPGRAALETLLRERSIRIVGFADWKAIEAAEMRRAVPPAPRRKFATVAEMLEALDSAPSSGAVPLRAAAGAK